MKLTFSNKKFAIFDNVLPDDLFQKVWIHAQHDSYTSPSSAGNWIKVWRIGDGLPLGSQEYSWNKRPFNNYMDLVGHYFIELAKNVTEILGDWGVWDDLVLRSYIYPQGTKLSWHNDSDRYTGAFTYYIHPYWGSTWGGELMVADVPPINSMKDRPLVGPHLEHSWEDSYIMERGAGQYISPKPNRCVVMAGGTYHSINRVDRDAGDKARVSIVGFTMKSSKPPEVRVPESDSEFEIKSI